MRMDVLGTPQRARWKVIPRSATEYSIAAQIRSFCPEVVHRQRIMPFMRSDARPNTLSSRYGLEAFPNHTDFAGYDMPARYIILTAPRARPTDTLVFDALELERVFGCNYLQRCIFLVRAKRPFYCRLLTVVRGEPLFRYNSAIMEPKNIEACEIARYIETGMTSVCRVNWTETRASLLDNWTMLHSRDTYCADKVIGLVRFAIWGETRDLDF